MARRAKTAATWALYHMEETSHLNWQTINDTSGNGRHLTQPGSTSSDRKRDMPKPRNIRRPSDGVGLMGRWCADSSNPHYASRTASPGDLAATFQSTWTFKFFLEVPSLAAQMAVYAYAHDGDTGNTANHQLCVRVNTSGYPEIFWEDGNGTNRVHTFSVGTPLSVNVADDWIFTKTATHIRWYRRCVFQSQVAIIAQPTGGSACVHNFGKDQPTSTLEFTGTVRSMMLRNVVESDAEILAQADLINTTMMHTETGSSVMFHWPMTEDGDANDSSDRGMHLCQHQTGGDIVAGVTGIGSSAETRGKYWGTSGSELVAPPPPDPNALATRAIFDDPGSYTFALIYRPGDSFSANPGLFEFGLAGNDNAPGADNLIGFGFNGTNDFRYGHEYNQMVPTVIYGVDQEVDIVDIHGTGAMHGLHHLVITWDGVADILTIYLNRNIVFQNNLVTPNIGGNGFVRLAVGTLNQIWHGVIGPFAILTEHWDQDDVDADYDLFFGGGEPGASPTIACISPA